MTGPLKKLLELLGLGGGNGSEPGPDDMEMLPCNEVLERLFEYLDGEIESERTVEQVERHLEICRRCYPRLQFERAFMDTLRAARAGQEPPPEMRRRVLGVLSEEGLEVG